ncbi:hypothetical protein ABW19_dt0201087 [Dactylella cylindrospora]|nr:hypothetical protein ABW19_dt0201087 [Dactylella cylindrospora]
MSSKSKDMRRPDLIVPYQAPPPPNPETSTTISSTMSSTLPMAAMFLRNKPMAWASMSFAIQTWLSETPAMRAAGQQPAFFSIIFSAISILLSYMPTPPRPGAVPTQAGAPAAQPAP